MFKGCGIDLTTILRSLTTFVKALIVLLLAASFWELMQTELAREAKINAYQLQLAHLQLGQT